MSADKDTADIVERLRKQIDGSAPLLRRVMRTVDDWNNDPDQRIAHPFTALVTAARLTAAPLSKQEG